MESSKKLGLYNDHLFGMQCREKEMGTCGLEKTLQIESSKGLKSRGSLHHQHDMRSQAVLALVEGTKSAMGQKLEGEIHS